MKKTILGAMLTLAIAFNAAGAFATGVGYIDYNAISSQYSLAKKYNADLQKKTSDFNAFVKNEQAKIAQAKTDQQKKEIRQKAQEQIKIKDQEYVAARKKYEAELVSKLNAAAEQVRVAKKLDIIVRKDVRVTGGVDCTADVLKLLK